MKIRIDTLFAAAFAALSLTAHADSTSLLAKAQAANPTRYQFAVTKNAEIRSTTDNKSYTIWWQPSATTTPSGVIVGLHGHDSYATDEFFLWQPYAEKKGYALLALQWWFGGGETVLDYYQPVDMYPLIANLLLGKGIKPGAVLFVGYSRGSTNTYAVTALDAVSGNRFITLTLSNSGGATPDYGPNKDIEKGVYGSKPFTGIQWAMYCGENDPDPAASGCPAMTAAKDWVTKYGANVVLFIDDPTGDHGGFMTNSKNVETALATFAPSNRYADADKIFDWAEKQYPSLLPTRVASSLGGGYFYRCYSSQTVCVGAKNDDLYVYQAGKITKVGTVADFLPLAAAVK